MTRFYIMTEDTQEKLFKANLTAAEWRLFSYFAMIEPFGDNYREMPDVVTIMQKANVKKSTFYLAIAKFQELGLFDFQVRGMSVRNLEGSRTKQAYTAVSTEENSNIPRKRNFTPEIRNLPPEIRNLPPENRNPVLETGIEFENSENRRLEPVPKAEFVAPQTIQTQDKKDQQQTPSVVDSEITKELIKEKLDKVRCTPSLEINPQVEEAIETNLGSAEDAIAYLKECIKTWDGRRTYNWTGVFVKALKEGQKPKYGHNGNAATAVSKIPPMPEELAEWWNAVDGADYDCYYSDREKSYMIVEKTAAFPMPLIWADAIAFWNEEMQLRKYEAEEES